VSPHFTAPSLASTTRRLPPRSGSNRGTLAEVRYCHRLTGYSGASLMFVVLEYGGEPCWRLLATSENTVFRCMTFTGPGSPRGCVRDTFYFQLVASVPAVSSVPPVTGGQPRSQPKACDFLYSASTRTTEVAICRSGIVQYFLSRRFFSSSSTIENPFFS